MGWVESLREVGVGEDGTDRKLGWEDGTYDVGREDVVVRLTVVWHIDGSYQEKIEKLVRMQHTSWITCEVDSWQKIVWKKTRWRKWMRSLHRLRKNKKYIRKLRKNQIRQNGKKVHLVKRLLWNLEEQRLRIRIKNPKINHHQYNSGLHLVPSWKLNNKEYVCFLGHIRDAVFIIFLIK